MQYIRGDYLTPAVKSEVLRMFVHRWTHENAVQTYNGRCPACAQQHACTAPQLVNGKRWLETDWHAYHAPLVSDAEWLRSHVFFVTDGGKLSRRHKHCEPYVSRERKY